MAKQSLYEQACDYFYRSIKDKHDGLEAVFSETYQRTGVGEDKYIACSRLMLDYEYSHAENIEDIELALQEIIGDDPNL